MLIPKVFRKPTLVANRHQIVGVAVIHHRGNAAAFRRAINTTTILNHCLRVVIARLRIRATTSNAYVIINRILDAISIQICYAVSTEKA